jgi:hypothetical protein
MRRDALLIITKMKAMMASARAIPTITRRNVSCSDFASRYGIGRLLQNIPIMHSSFEDAEHLHLK